MKSDKVTIRGSAVVRSTRVLVQESENPSPSETNTCMSLQFYNVRIISSQSCRQSRPIGALESTQETASARPSKYQPVGFQNDWGTKCLINVALNLWVIYHHSSGLRIILLARQPDSLPVLPPLRIWPSHFTSTLEGALICVSWRRIVTWMKIFLNHIFVSAWEKQVVREKKRLIAPIPTCLHLL